MSGKVFTEKLLPTEGAVALLYELGFSESDDNEFLVLDQINLDKISRLRFVINRMDSARSSRQVEKNQRIANESAATNVQSYPLFEKQLQIKRIVDSSLHHVVQWESDQCRKKVREVIPVTDLYKRASETYNSLTEEYKAELGKTNGEYLKHSLLIILR